MAVKTMLVVLGVCVIALVGLTAPTVLAVVALTSLFWIALIYVGFYRTPRKPKWRDHGSDT